MAALDVGLVVIPLFPKDTIQKKGAEIRVWHRDSFPPS